MAYFNKEMKKKLAPAVKAVFKKYNMKGSLAVDNYSTFVVNLKSGEIDFGKDNIQVNHYWISEHFTGKARDFLLELVAAMNVGNYNNSDIQTDYFDVGWYISINVGRWDKPYVVVSE